MDLYLPRKLSPSVTGGGIGNLSNEEKKCANKNLVQYDDLHWPSGIMLDITWFDEHQKSPSKINQTQMGGSSFPGPECGVGSNCWLLGGQPLSYERLMRVLAGTE